MRGIGLCQRAKWGCERTFAILSQPHQRVKKVFLTRWWRGSPLPRHYHPYQFPLKSYGFPGAETARKRFLLWKMGFSAAAYCEPMHPSIQHGRTTALAGSLAALPASLGLLRAVSPTGRALRAPPPYTPPGTIKARKGFGSTIRHGRSASSHHATFSGPVFRCCARRSFSSPFQKTPAHGFTNATICGIL